MPDGGMFRLLYTTAPRDAAHRQHIEDSLIWLVDGYLTPEHRQRLCYEARALCDRGGMPETLALATAITARTSFGTHRIYAH